MFRNTLQLLSRNTIFEEIRRNGSTVGFIGLGNMGNYMVTNLLKKGAKVAVYDIDQEAIDKLSSKGAKGCRNAADVASKSDVVFTMLPNNDIVYSTYTGKDGVFSGAKEDTLFVDSSTISPDVAKKVAHEAQKKGFNFIDAPVSGGVVGARDATLTFMVGGSEDNMCKAEPHILKMGKKLVHCGDTGAGQVAKICNNMLLGISMIGVAEAYNLGIRMGLKGKTLFDIINTSTGRCWSSDTYNPVPNLMENVPSANNYEGGFSCCLINKDLGIAEEIASKSFSPIPMGSLAHQLYMTMVKEGFGNKDFAIIYQFLKREK